ncbi:MAG: hypothetical protein JWQ04_414 [Pedosphaera sp.]|nr:hypothetical protein [Pedosphaera sp.]
MKIAMVGILGLILATSSGLTAEEGAEKTITKSFAAAPGGALKVDLDGGDIQVLTGDQNTVEVVVERQVTGGTEKQAASLLKSHKVTFTQDGKEVRVEASKTKKRGFSFRSKPNLSVRVRVTVPRRFNVSLNTDGGTIQVSDLQGTVDARSSGGDLSFTKIEGAVAGHTSGGNVKAAGCTDKLEVQTSGGNILLRDYSGTSATADTSGGNVDVHSCAGKLQVKTSGGNIVIDGFSGPGVYADTSGGAITFGLDQQPEGDCWLHTSGGNITVRLPENIAMNLIAATDGGNVTTAIPVAATVQGKLQEGKLEGKMNGGGPVLSLRTSGGDIRVTKK